MVPLTGDDAKLRYGNYDVELFKAPVIVRDKDQLKKLPCKLRVSIERPGQVQKLQHPPQAKQNEQYAKLNLY